MQKNIDCKNRLVLANNRKACCFIILNVHKKNLIFENALLAPTCVCMLMCTQVHERLPPELIIAEFVLKSCKCAPPILIITGLRVIITACVKLYQINIHIQLVTCSKRHKILHRAHCHPTTLKMSL
jgi:hypothetical protein